MSFVNSDYTNNFNNNIPYYPQLIHDVTSVTPSDHSNHIHLSKDALQQQQQQSFNNHQLTFPFGQPPSSTLVASSPRMSVLPYPSAAGASDNSPADSTVHNEYFELLNYDDVVDDNEIVISTTTTTTGMGRSSPPPLSVMNNERAHEDHAEDQHQHQHLQQHHDGDVNNTNVNHMDQEHNTDDDGMETDVMSMMFQLPALPSSVNPIYYTANDHYVNGLIEEEREVPFFDGSTNDIFMDLNLPTIYNNYTFVDSGGGGEGREEGDCDPLLLDMTSQDVQEQVIEEEEEENGSGGGEGIGHDMMLIRTHPDPNADVVGVGDGNEEFLLLIDDDENNNTGSENGGFFCAAAAGDRHVSMSPTIIKHEKLRNTVLSILVKSILIKIEQIQGRTGASVNFILSYAHAQQQLQCTEKNVESFLAELEQRSKKNYGQPTLTDVNSSSASSSSGAAAATTTGAGRININGLEFEDETDTDDDADSNSNSDKNPEGQGDKIQGEVENQANGRGRDRRRAELGLGGDDHIYAAKELRQRFSSPNFNDHQYLSTSTSSSAAAATTKRGRPLSPPQTTDTNSELYSSPAAPAAFVPISTPATSASAAAREEEDLMSASRRLLNKAISTFFRTDYLRTRVLKKLLEVLFRQVGKLEEKTGAQMEVCVDFVGHVLRREDYAVLLEDLTLMNAEFGLAGIKSCSGGVSSSSHPVAKKASGPVAVSTEVSKRARNGLIPYTMAPGFAVVDPTSLSPPPVMNNGVQAAVEVEIPLSAPHDPLISRSSSSNDLSMMSITEMDDHDHTYHHTFTFPDSRLSNHNYSRPIMSETQRASASISNLANIINGGPICSKCSGSIPPGFPPNSSSGSGGGGGAAAGAQWTWLRCYNPLCFHMVHSACLGFYIHCGPAIDLTNFPFPPYYCKQHRFTTTAAAAAATAPNYYT